MPYFILFLNAYYITGIERAIQPLICQGLPDERYLQADPLTRCWSAEHWQLLAWDFLAILIYFVLMPGMIYFVLFVLVPRRGLENEQLNHNLGFLWNRFEARCYWVRRVGCEPT